MHPVLLRQLKRLGLEEGGAPPTPEQWVKLLDRMNRAYLEADQDRYTLERALEISSREMREANDSLSRAKEDAEHAARAKGEFLAVMSHEIRTPMNGVLGMVGILLGTNLTAEQRECATIVESSARALLTILDDILNFSKIEAGRLELESIEFELASVVEDVLSLFAEKAQGKGLELAGIVAPDLPRRVVGDPARLRQIVSNLVGNAIKFTTHGSVVVRVARGEGDTIRFAVHDTGTGLTQDQIGRLFTPFSQADSSTTRKFGGTGLGLAICKRLAIAMGGDIGVRSEPDRGSTFEFTARLTAGATQRTGCDLDLTDRRYLVAESQAASREALVARIEAAGGNADVATSTCAVLPLVAVAREERRPYEVVFVDASWIHECGHETLAQLRSLARVVTVDTWAVHAAAGSAADGVDANDFVAKPVGGRALRRVLMPQLDAVRAPLPTPVLERTAYKRPTRVLLVEDNSVNQRVAKLQLQKLGIKEIDLASNGLLALERLETGLYDLVLMDCQMPEMDGFEATKRLRERERADGLPHTPVIAMTANAMGGDRERCLEAGMDDYLSKPATQAALESMLRRWVTDAHELRPDSVAGPG